MKNIIKEFILILCILISISPGYGQTDSSDHQRGMEEYGINTRFQDRNLAIRINGTGSLLSTSPALFMYGIGASVEFKKWATHSFGGNISLANSNEWSPVFGYNSSKTSLQIDLSYRYYHNLKSRMSKGRTGNNFSANYFFFSPGLWLQYKDYILKDYHWDFDQGIWVLEYEKPLVLRPNIKLGYGIQRSFLNNLNFDMNGGILLRKWEGSLRPAEFLYLNISLGYKIK